MDTIGVMRGTLDLLVLKALGRSEKHGFEVTSWIEARTGGSLGFDDSAVYQALYRMDKRGLIESEWGVTENNRRARYYRISVAGLAHLEKETARLIRYTATIADVLQEPAT